MATISEKIKPILSRIEKAKKKAASVDSQLEKALKATHERFVEKQTAADAEVLAAQAELEKAVAELKGIPAPVEPEEVSHDAEPDPAAV